MIAARGISKPVFASTNKPDAQARAEHSMTVRPSLARFEVALFEVLWMLSTDLASVEGMIDS